MSNLYDAKLAIEKLISSKELDPVVVKGLIALKTGIVLDSIFPGTPDDYDKTDKLLKITPTIANTNFSKLNKLKLHFKSFNSILWILVVMFICTGILSFYLLYTFEKHYQTAITKQIADDMSASSAAYQNIEKYEFNLLSNSIQSFVSNPGIIDAFLNNNRYKLYELCAPIYNNLLKTKRITKWLFINNYKEAKVLLRVHNPSHFMDYPNSKIFKKTVESRQVEYGTEVDSNSINLTVYQPYYFDNQSVGYIGVSKDISDLLPALKSMTSLDYSLIIDRKFLDAKDQDIFEENSVSPSQSQIALTISSTLGKPVPPAFTEDFEEIPEFETPLNTITINNETFISGIFPISSTGIGKIGGLIVYSNITTLHNDIKTIQNQIVLFCVILMLVILFTFILTFRKKKALKKHLHNIIMESIQKIGGKEEPPSSKKTKNEFTTLETHIEELRNIVIQFRTESRLHKDNVIE